MWPTRSCTSSHVARPASSTSSPGAGRRPWTSLSGSPRTGSAGRGPRWWTPSTRAMWGTTTARSTCRTSTCGSSSTTRAPALCWRRPGSRRRRCATTSARSWSTPSPLAGASARWAGTRPAAGWQFPPRSYGGRSRSGLRCRSVGTSRRDVRGLGGRTDLTPTPQLWEVPTMAQSMSLVGLDVHASQTPPRNLDTVSGELRGVKLRVAPSEVVEFLATLPGPVRAVYEAGPTGFGLARAGGERGIDVRVVAAGKVPRASGDRIKTDKRDAERLARLLAAGELRFAFVPSVADEQFRDVIRAIEDCRGDLMRAGHRLSKLLLRRDLRWEGPGSAWTQAHLRWLGSLRFDDVCSQAVFVDYLAGVQMLVARRAALIATVEQVIPDTRHAITITRWRCFRGIDTLSAAALCAEVSDGNASSPAAGRVSR